MPELPEVETLRRHLAAVGLGGSRITSVYVQWPRTVFEDVHGCTRALSQRAITGVERHGKLLLLRLSDDSPVTIHLRMSGRIVFGAESPEVTPYVRLALSLEGAGWMCLHDPRKFARVSWGARASEQLAAQGTDLLSPTLTEAAFAVELARRRRMIKALLLDQSIFAGLGNIYTDEALWSARIHPERLSHTIGRERSRVLFRAVRSALYQGIRHGGTALGSGASNFRVHETARPAHQAYLNVFRRTGMPCPRCGATIARIVVGQRSTHLCPVCQAFSTTMGVTDDST